MELVWFRGHKWIKENLKKKTTYVVFGKVSVFNGVFSMSHPEMELKSEFDKSLRSSIQPIYPSTELLSNRGISNRVICKLIEQIFIQALEDPSAYNIDDSSIVNYGVKIQKFFSKTEILNCSRNGNYFQEFYA